MIDIDDNYLIRELLEELTSRSVEGMEPAFLSRRSVGFATFTEEQDERTDEMSEFERELMEKAIAVLETRNEDDPAYIPIGIRSIIDKSRRPGFLVRNDRVVVPPGYWSNWYSTTRNKLEGVVASIAKISVGESAVGTGFHLGRGLIATNHHVASLFCRQTVDNRYLISNYARISFPSLGQFRALELKFTGVLYWGDSGKDATDFDLAILSTNMPAPYERTGLQPQNWSADTRSSVVIGFPTGPGRGNSQGDFNQIFPYPGGMYMCPGNAFSDSRWKELVRHDCSTGRGSSGSPLIDPTTGHLLGIHSDGDRVEFGNYGISGHVIKYKLQNLRITT